MISLRERSITLEMIKIIINSWKRVLILDDNLVQGTVIYRYSKGTMVLSYKKSRAPQGEKHSQMKPLFRISFNCSLLLFILCLYHYIWKNRYRTSIWQNIYFEVYSSLRRDSRYIIWKVI